MLKYNPAFLPEEELVRSFTVRQTDLELLIESIRDNTAASNQHLLVIGPRGMGKTTLVRRAAAAVRADAELRVRWYPILFGEEAYEVGTAGEFWLEAIFFVAKQLGAERWQQIHTELKGERDERRLQERALGHLMDFAEREGKRLLLVVENLNLLLGEQIDPDAAWTLRHTLQNEPRVMLLATATSRFEEIEHADRAMYELFRVQELRPLDAEECRVLWEARTGGMHLEGNRIRPIEILTGGNPRLLVILASFAPEKSLRTLMDELIHLVDEHTSYFKANLEVLPALERKVFVTLADLWRPATAREVADGSRLDVNKASAMLHRLENRGAVTIVSQRARAKRYQVAERLYNIYHLMRRGGEPAQRVRHVVEFMHALYEPEQLVRATVAIAREACELGPSQREDHYHAYRQILERVEKEELRRRIVEATEPSFFKQPDAPEELRELVAGAPASQEDASVQRAKSEAKAEELYRHVEASPTATGWLKVGTMFWALEHRLEDAEAAFREALTLDPSNLLASGALGMILGEMGHSQEQKAMLLKASMLEPSTDVEWVLLGATWESLERFEDAAHAYRHALEMDAAQPMIWERLGNLLLTKLDRHEEAESAYRKALTREPPSVTAIAGLLLILAANPQRGKEALEFAEEVVARTERDARILSTTTFLLSFSPSIDVKQLEVWGREALEKSSKDNLQLVAWLHLLARLSRWDEAAGVATRLLTDRTGVERFLPVLIQLLCGAAAAGQGQRFLELIERSPSVDLLEPLVVALRLDAGQEPEAAQEISEVARDLCEGIAKLRKLYAAPVEHSPIFFRIAPSGPEPESEV